MYDGNIELLAHLMRRAGFGATRRELESCAAAGYEATVAALLQVDRPQVIPDDLIRRYHVESSGMMGLGVADNWLYRMVSTTAPLQEKMALFWHGIFATGISKVVQGKVLSDQIRMFRRYGMDSFRTLLAELSKDPAMILWLDNQENRRGAINENYGRELLELFSMGVGNYTEDDIKECARAFTGWTIGNTRYMETKSRRDSVWPYGRIAWHFEYRQDDHDDGEKVFLGHRGRFNGEDIIDIICAQPAAAQFISRHMYNFFVADEPPVPQWPHVPPRDPEAIDTLSRAYFETNYDIRSMLRVLFNSEFFRARESRYAKVKSPAELVAGVLRLTGEFQSPRFEMPERSLQMGYMGQQLANPPTVEGWHQGTEWIDSGALMERINFATDRVGVRHNPGVREMIDAITTGDDDVLSPERLVDACLEQLGAIEVSADTRATLVWLGASGGDVRLHSPADDQARDRVAEMLRMAAATPEFQRN